MDAKSTRVFLSYNSKDIDEVEKVARFLASPRLALSFDKNMPPGTQWITHLSEQLAMSDVVLVAIGRHGEGPFQSQEIEAALRQSLATSGKRKRIIPILLPGAQADPELPSFLSSYQCFDTRSGLTPDRLDALEKSLRWPDEAAIAPSRRSRRSPTLAAALVALIGVTAAFFIGRNLGITTDVAAAQKSIEELNELNKELRKQLEMKTAERRLNELPADQEAQIRILAQPGRWMPRQEGHRFLVPNTYYDGEEKVPHSITALGACGALDPSTEGLYKLYVILACAFDDRPVRYYRSMDYPGDVSGLGVVLEPSPNYTLIRDQHPEEFSKLERIQNFVRTYRRELVDLELLQP